ncbi:MAG TPA: NADPH-dependent glutamate synthase [Bacilli bacterium]|nr:NADPH-dependent glutamate synthase [Bacilli bacterium]
MNSKNYMRLLEIEKRVSTFDEVALGYNKQEAYLESLRCLNCKTKPCVASCPVNIDIPRFIMQVKAGDVNNAYHIIAESNLLPGVCGRVCPQESQCELTCVRAIKGEAVAIGRLERYVADNYRGQQTVKVASNGLNVAVIGSGPAGLACAGVLIEKGYNITVYEAMHENGGVLVYGIPEFRLPKRIVKAEIDNLRQMGVKFENNVVVGKTILLEDLQQTNDAIFIGTGAGLPKFMDIPGENYNSVLSANEFLTRINLMKAYKKEYDTPLKKMNNVAVIGGGNVAIDAARSAKRLGANVYLIYRRGFKEMPARLEEVHHAQEEGIIFKNLTNPIAIKADEKGRVKTIICQEMVLGALDASGRSRPIAKENADFSLDVDTVIVAIGNYPNPLLRRSTTLVTYDKYDCLIVDENNKTTCEGIYGGGDVVTGAATVILAMGAGKKAAYAIDKYLQTKEKR